MTSECPGYDRLERLLADEVDDDERRMLEKHLASCPICPDRLESTAENLRIVDRVEEAFDLDVIVASPAPGVPPLGVAPHGVAPHGVVTGSAAATDTRGGAWLSPGSYLGRFRIGKELGRGGHGVVYLGEDVRLHREVAIKLLSAQRRTPAPSPKRLATLEAEARILATLDHPNIATVYSLEEAEGVHFVTMELARGETLGARLARGPLTLPKTLSVGRHIARALEAAHVRSVVHLDLKPANVVLSGRGVKVLDFGLARLLDRPSDDPGLAGTPGFMSPEQARGETADARADIWALGCLLFACATGCRPFPGSTITERIAATLDAEPEWGSVDAEVPTVLRELIDHCLEKDRAARPQSAREVRERIEDLFELVGRGRRRHERGDGSIRREGRLIERGDGESRRLPSSLASFVGRTREIRWIEEHLAQHLLVTLFGTGGAGKSRLALEAAHRVSIKRVFWVGLAPIVDESEVVERTVLAVGLRPRPGDDLVEALARHLAVEPSLLVLDNCEHLLEGCATLVHRLLDATGEGLRILATSREVLGIPGEQVLSVRGLSTGTEWDPSAGTTPGGASSESEQLFLDRARDADDRFDPVPAERAAIASICRHLEGLPLALELAAAQVRRLPVRELERRLHESISFLSPQRGTIEHHRTLRALFDWSYERLFPNERLIFERLSVFTGGWTIEEAEEVLGFDGLQPWEVLDLLAKLSEKSLVERDERRDERHDGRRDERRASSHVRFRLLEPIRLYARDRAAERARTHPEEAETLQLQHARAYLRLARDAVPHLTGPSQTRWYERLAEDHDNFGVALRCFIEQSVAGPAFEMVAALGRYWQVRGHLREGRGWCRDVIEAFLPPRALSAIDAMSGNASSMLDVESAPIDTTSRMPVRRRDGVSDASVDDPTTTGLEDPVVARLEDPVAVRVLVQAGTLMAMLGEADAAKPWLVRSRSLAQFRGWRKEEAVALNALGGLAFRCGDQENGRFYFERALALWEELGEDWGVAAAANNLAVIVARGGDFDSARSYLEKSLLVRRRLGDIRGVGQCLNNLADLEIDQGLHERAAERLRECLTLQGNVGDPVALAMVEYNLGRALLYQDEHEAARTHFIRSLERFRELGARRETVGALEGLARLELFSGRIADGCSRSMEALRIHLEFDDPRGIARTVQNIGICASLSGDLHRGVQLLAAAERCRAELGGWKDDPRWRAIREDVVERAERELGSEAYREAWNAGSSLPREAVAALALSNWS